MILSDTLHNTSHIFFLKHYHYFISLYIYAVEQIEPTSSVPGLTSHLV